VAAELRPPARPERHRASARPWSASCRTTWTTSTTSCGSGRRPERPRRLSNYFRASWWSTAVATACCPGAGPRGAAAGATEQPRQAAALLTRRAARPTNGPVHNSAAADPDDQGPSGRGDRARSTTGKGHGRFPARVITDGPGQQVATAAEAAGGQPDGHRPAGCAGTRRARRATASPRRRPGFRWPPDRGHRAFDEVGSLRAATTCASPAPGWAPSGGRSAPRSAGGQAIAVLELDGDRAVYRSHRHTASVGARSALGRSSST